MRIGKIARYTLILAVVGLLGWLVKSKFDRVEKFAAENPGSKKKDSRFTVDGYVVTPSSIDNAIDAAGTLISNESVEIKPEITGRVTGIYFNEGSYVKEGTLLVKLYDADIKAQLQKLESQRALSQKTLERQQELFKINGISQQEIDITANQVAIYDAEIDLVKAQLQRTEIRAPFDGVIGLRSISSGAIVSPTTVIATLLQNNPLKIDFSVPEKYRSMLSANDYIEFTVAADERKYRGTVYVIDPQIDLTTRTIKMRAYVNNPSGALAPGTFASVKLILKNTPNALMIPSQAIIPGARDKKVIIADSGRAKFVTVETGIRTEKDIQIVSGISTGDTILISGMLQVKPGMQIRFANLKTD